MKILLAQRLPWFSALAGETKFSRWLCETLTERGHSCRAVALATTTEGPDALTDLRAFAERRGVPRRRSSPDADVYAWGGVDVHAVPDGRRLWTTLAEQIREFAPDRVVVSQDRTYLTLATALAEADPARVVYTAHSQATLPFGPECFRRDDAQTDLLRRTGAVVASSRYIGRYISQWSGIQARVFRFSSCGPGPFPNLGRPGAGFITMVNPSRLKGIDIFERLAAARPAEAFAAVPTWATTGDDLDRLGRLDNVRLLAPSEQIGGILAQTRILLVPSLWGEGFGLVATEAMLHGIPVLASDIGGLPEAKLGVDYLLPVRPIEEYPGRGRRARAADSGRAAAGSRAVAGGARPAGGPGSLPAAVRRVTVGRDRGSRRRQRGAVRGPSARPIVAADGRGRRQPACRRLRRRRSEARRGVRPVP